MKRIILIVVFFCFFLLAINFCGVKNEKNIIKFSSWGSQSEVEILKGVISDFEQDNPDVKVDFIHIPQNYYQKIHLLFASNLAPDVIFINNQYLPMYIDAGLLENLTPYLNKKDFIKESLEILSDDDGNIYAVPRDISNLVIYYNKDIFKEKGVIVPKKIKNIYELKDLALKLTDKAHWGINFEKDPLYWLYYLASNSSGALSDDKKNIIITSDKSVKAFNLYKDFVYKYKIAPSSSKIGSKTTAQMFINSQLAMYLGGRWMVPKFRQTLKFDWDIIQFPACDGAKLYSDASGWAVSKNSKNKTNAIKFISYLSSKKAINEFTNSGLIIPARVDSFNEFILNKDELKPKNMSVYSDMLKISKPTPVNQNYSSVNDILREKSQNFLESDLSFNDVFDKKTLKELESLL